MPESTAPQTAPEKSQVAVTPDEEVAARVEELDELRAAIQKKREDRQRKEQGLSHDLRVTELDVEKVRLLTELAQEERLEKQTDGSSDNTFANAEAAMIHAVNQANGLEDLNKAEDKAAEKAEKAEEKPVEVLATEPPASQAAVKPVTTPKVGK